MKFLSFLIVCNLILSGYLIIECVSIRQAMAGFKVQLVEVQIIASRVLSYIRRL